MSNSGTQEIFKSVYRGRQTVLHDLSYMRMSKVLLALRVINRVGIELEGRDIFDYGFGAGAFFRYCPPSARLYGVEVDPENVEAVKARYKDQHTKVDLRTISIANWEEHPLLEKTYDLVLCSHVLEHMQAPRTYLRNIQSCLNERGAFLGLVPINERAENPHHLHTVDREVIDEWVQATDLDLTYYVEADPWTYWFQWLYTTDAELAHRLVQTLNLMIGIPATAIGPAAWEYVSKVFATLTRSKNTQAAFVLEG